MRIQTLLVLGLTICTSAQHNMRAQRNGTASDAANHHPTPAPRPLTTTERDFDAMSLFSLLEEVMNDSGPTAYSYDEPNAPSASHDYEEPKMPDHEYEDQKTTADAYEEKKLPAQGYAGQKPMVHVYDEPRLPSQGYTGQKPVVHVYDEPKLPAQGYAGQKPMVHVYDESEISATQEHKKQNTNTNVYNYEKQQTNSNKYEEAKTPAQEYVGQQTAHVGIHEEPKINAQVYENSKLTVSTYDTNKYANKYDEPKIPAHEYVGQKQTLHLHEESKTPAQGYVAQKTTANVGQIEEPKINAQKYEKPKTTVTTHEEPKIAVQEYVEKKTAVNVHEEPKIAAQENMQKKTAVNVHEDPKIAAQEYVRKKTADNVHEEPKIAAQEYTQQKTAVNVQEDPKIVAQEYVQQKTAANVYEEPKLAAVMKEKPPKHTITDEEPKIIAQEYVHQKTAAHSSQTNIKPQINLKEDTKTSTQKHPEQKPTTHKYDEPKTTTPVYVDPEPLQLTNYRMPVHYTFNNGQPFYLEKDPVTGDIDFESKKLQLQNVQSSPKSDDYFYDEEIENDGIDRKDGKILTSHVDKNNPFNNLPLSYNDFKKVNDYSNHNHKYSDFPLISSSYANTKVQGTAGEKIMNHKPYVTSSTHSPSYYTMKPKLLTTELTPYNSDDYDGETVSQVSNYGDKIQKKPTEGTFSSRRPPVSDRPSGTDLHNKRPSIHSNAPNPSSFGSQYNKRPVVDAITEETSKVETVYSKRPTEESFLEKPSGFDSQYNKEPIADRPENTFGFGSPYNKRPAIPTSSETYFPNKHVPSKPLHALPNVNTNPSQSGYVPEENYPSTTQNNPIPETHISKIPISPHKPPVRDSNFAPESSFEENHSEDYEYYDSQAETTAQNFVTPIKPLNYSTESSATHKTEPQQYSTSSTDSNVHVHQTEHNTVFPSSSNFNTEFNIHHIAAQPNQHSNTEPSLLGVRPIQNSHSSSESTGYKVVEDFEVEPGTVPTSTTQRPLIGTIIYAEHGDKSSTFPSIVYSESATRLPGNVVTSMPLGTSFHFNRPNTGSQFLHPTRQELKPAANNFVTNIEANTGGSFINQGGKKESAYGIFGEEPFRPIFGPGDKSAEGLQINPGQNLVVPKIPQETPNRWNYPNAPVNPESFFQMKTEKTEAPPRLTGVEPPFKKPTPFLREPVNTQGNSWGNSQQLFQVSTHVKFPAESQETTDNIAEEGNTAPPTFNLPPQRPDVYQTIPQRHYQQPIRGSILPNRPNGIPDSPPRTHYVGPKRPVDENFDRETGIPTVPSRESISPQRPGETFPVRGAPVAAFNILLKEGGHPQKLATENSPTRVQGSAINVPLRENNAPPRPNFPQDEGQNLNIPIGVNIVNVGAQGPNQPPVDANVATTGSKPSDKQALPGEIPNLPLTEMEGNPPFMNEPAGMLQPPKPLWDRPDRPRPNQFFRKPFPPTRRHGPNNLPNILPQFRPNAKVSHHEGNRIGYFPQRQPLLERQRPVTDHLIPPPSRLRNRNDNVDELMAYDAYHQSPPGPILRRPFVHRRAGPHVDHHNPRPQTLQMIQQFPRQPQLPRDNLIKDPERPVFVVYPSNPGSKPGNMGKLNPDKEVVVGIRGPHLPVPPANLDTEDDIMSAIPYQHNKNQTPLLQPVKERTDRPIILTLPTSRPVKNDFPYALVEPEENSEDESEEANTEVAKSSIDETIEAEVYNNHPPNHEDTEINVIPYLQDYMPFATRKPVMVKPNEPVTVSENQWPFDRKNQEGKILTKSNVTDDHISVTLKTVSTSSSAPVVSYVPTTSAPFRITDYPRPGSTVEKGSAHHKTVVASEGSEFTLSAVMHTIPQSSSEVSKRKDSPHVTVVHSSSPNLHLPQNHNNGENIAPNQNFQAPFMASANVGATPLSQGWNILASSNTNERMKPGTVDKADLDIDDEDQKETEMKPASEHPNFDFENFKPQLFGGFKPIYTVPEESSAIKRPQTTEREEKKLL